MVIDTKEFSGTAITVENNYNDERLVTAADFIDSQLEKIIGTSHEIYKHYMERYGNYHDNKIEITCDQTSAKGLHFRSIMGALRDLKDYDNEAKVNALLLMSWMGNGLDGKEEAQVASFNGSDHLRLTINGLRRYIENLAKERGSEETFIHPIDWSQQGLYTELERRPERIAVFRGILDHGNMVAVDFRPQYDAGDKIGAVYFSASPFQAAV